MVIDDSKIVIDRLVPAIKEQTNTGEIFHGYNFEDARQLLTNIKIDIAVLDINMPGKNGIELLQCIKRKTQFSHIVVIMMTEEATESKKQKCLSMGADHFIDKFEGFEKIISIIANNGSANSNKTETTSS